MNLKIKKSLSLLSFPIFVKLFFVMLLTGLLVFVVLGLFLNRQFHQNIEHTFKMNIENYYRYLAQEIGSPPDTVKARQLAQTYRIRISYQNANLTWSSANQYPEIERMHFFQMLRRHRINWMQLQPFTIQNPDSSRVQFSMDHSSLLYDHKRRMLEMLAGVLSVFGFSFLLIRYILKPIKLLQQGVQQISRGNLQHTIPEKRRDELGNLTESFNNMTRRIREMIQARDQLLLDVSHELLSPLTRIKLALEFLPKTKNRTSILDDTAEIEKMIAEILETERLKEGHGRLRITAVNLPELIRNVVRDFQPSTPAIRLIALPQKMTVNADMERMRMVFKNLIENSLKYSLPDSRPVEISMTRGHEAVIVYIKDDGQGIPAGDMPYLFEPFYRVDKSRSKKTGGYGLGLHLCKKIIDAHQGEIKVYKNAGRGVTVEIRIKDPGCFQVLCVNS